MADPEESASITRRKFGVIAGSALTSFALTGSRSPLLASPQDALGRLKARPRENIKTSVSGEHTLGLAYPMGLPRDGLLHLPEKPPSTPMPLVVLFHGAASSAETQLRRFTTIPDELGIAVLATDSRLVTWDAIRNDFAADVMFLDRALEYTFGVVNVDPKRIIMAGFSDGATYALGLGMVNGDLFQKILAFSPGFLIPIKPTGKPKIFISHGTADRVLPIDKTSRVIVPTLRERGYDVTFREFDGDHAAPEPIAREGFQWAVAAPGK